MRTTVQRLAFVINQPALVVNKARDFGESLRRTVERPVWVRNWWRPPGYNEAVMGDPLGDHFPGAVGGVQLCASSVCPLIEVFGT